MHLIDVDGLEREGEAIRRLLDNPFLTERILEPLGISHPYLVIVQLQKRRIAEGAIGDVDILAAALKFSESFDLAAEAERIGNLYPQLPLGITKDFAARKAAAADGIAWPPDLEYVIGVEVKCAYFQAGVRATKSSPRKTKHLRSQVDDLLSLGFDRVALLDVVANPPSEMAGFTAWQEAACQAAKSEAAMAEVLAGRLPPESAAGHFVWSAGAVHGGDESRRGAGAPRCIRRPKVPPKSAVAAAHLSVRSRLTKLLAPLPRPKTIADILLDCRHCRKIHTLSGGGCD